jgi:hypothetical protein
MLGRITLKTLALSLALVGGAHAQIVNIKGFGGDGAGANIYNYPVAPGTQVSLFNAVMVTLDAGDYLLSDAWGMAGATYDAWNFQADVAGSWAAHYVVASKGSDGGFTLLLDASEAGDPACTYHYCGWLTEQQASDQFLATAPFKLHLDTRTDLAFATADYALGDNLGGISLSITRADAVAAVPEPQTYALMLAGLIGMGVWARRQRGTTQR